MISRNTNIIIKPGSIIDSDHRISDTLVEVHGSKSGPHTGRIVITRDRRSILFYPDIPFDSEEKVTVKTNIFLKSGQGAEIPPFNFQFHTTILSNPVIASKKIESSKAMPLMENTFVKADSLPELNITISGETAPGKLFLAPTQFFSADGYLLITNDHADILYQEEVNGKVPFDFKLQPNGLISYGLLYEYFAFSGGGYTDFYVMNDTYSVIDEYQMGNEYIADFHDFLYLPNGHTILFGYDFQPVDMSEIVENGRPDAMVAGSIIQELDIDHYVVFQWRSWDYFNLADSYNDLSNKNFDAIHINSVDVSNDGNLVVSVLALGEVTKINRQTGEIMWRMGGKNNDFTFLNESDDYAPLYFMFQHDVRCLSNGNITMFDNGASQFNRNYSRVVEYAIDESAMTATKVWEYRHDPDIFVPTMGNAQRLPNGNTLIGWGFASLKEGYPVATEVDADGNVVMEMRFAESGFGSYRVFRYPYEGREPAKTVTVFEVQEGNTYAFKNADVNLGLTVTILEKPGFGYNELIGYYYNYGPFEPEFPEQAPLVLPMRYVLDQFSIDQLRLEMIFDVEYLGLKYPEQITIYYRMFEDRYMFFPLETNYNPVTKELKAIVQRNGLGGDGEIGEFIFTYPVNSVKMMPPILSHPVFEDTVNSALPLELTWSARGYATYHELQVSSDSLFTNLIVEEEYLMESIYRLDSIESGMRYYWRVRTSTDIDTSDWSTAWFETVFPFIEVTSPESGDTWFVGLKRFIEWEDNLDEDVIVQLFYQDTLNMIIDTVKSIGAYHWDVPYNLPLDDNYEIRVRSVSDSSLFGTSGYFSMDTSGTPEPEITEYRIYQNAPNPVSFTTTIRYDLPVESHVKIEIFNILGQRVALLLNGWIGKGENQVVWQPGISGAGLYFYRMRAKPLESESEYGNYQMIRKMMVLE
ncbi:aryl-sulfate sulfotransferase [bacterium]|nr:aryl-sulfate sulfotransferase [bacterium]